MNECMFKYMKLVRASFKYVLAYGVFFALKEWARPSHKAVNRGGGMEILKESRGGKMMIHPVTGEEPIKKRAWAC